MKYGDAFPQGYDLSSLNVLGTVGEPINPAVWKWYHTVVGNRRCPVVDTWWQTETGGHMLVSFPSLPQKPGYAGVPFFGIEAAVVDKNGNELPRGEKGYLAVKKPWPAALRGCWNNNKQFESYWTSIGTYYATGDYAVHDEEGYFQILGRTDDVITKAGYRIGSAELENALVAFPHVVEAAVIGKPHPLKGESIKAFVTLHQTAYQHGEIVEELQAFVKRTYSKHAIPEEIDIVASLPKTRSGKIMRRLLKAKELGKEIGDVSTLED
jgi:acetyl-CoA synthetase